MNQATLSGYISTDIELRRTESGKAVCGFNLAIRRTKDITDFIPITCWESTAEFVSKYFKKGSRIEVIARVQRRDWEDDTGKKHYSLEIVARDVEFGERAPDSGSSGKGKPAAAESPVPADAPQPAPAAPAPQDFTLMDEDALPPVPFPDESVQTEIPETAPAVESE